MIGERLENIKDAFEKLNEIQLRFGVLTKPYFTDFGLLRNLLYVFRMSSKAKEQLTAWQRKQFLFVVLWYYSPKTIFGGTMRHGLRNAISRTLRCSSTSLSHDCRDLYFYYRTYASFKDGVENCILNIDKILVC
jgi:hypothetical protein